MENNLISGIYLIYLKWDLIWLENKILNKIFTVKNYELRAILLKHFDSDYCDKIIESIYKYEKVIVDFDQNIVRKVVEKDMPFINAMDQYFSIANIEKNFDLESRTVNIEAK